MEKNTPTMKGIEEQTTGQAVLMTLEQLPERVRETATLRGLGYSYRKIAEAFGVTPQAVSLMITRHQKTLRDLRRSPDLSELSTRAVNALAKHGIRARADANGRDVLSLLQEQRNCGRKTLREIEHWLNDPQHVDEAKAATDTKDSGYHGHHSAGSQIHEFQQE